MKPHLPLSIGLLVIASVLLALLANGYSILSYAILWLIGLFAFGGLVSVFHHRAVHRSWAFDTVLVSSAVGLGLLASVLVFSLIGSLLPEGSVQPHVLGAIVAFAIGAVGVFVLQFAYAFAHATKGMLMRSLITGAVFAVLGVVFVHATATITIHDEVSQAFASGLQDSNALDRWESSQALIEGTPLSERMSAMRSDAHASFERTREPVRSCEGMVIDIVGCAHLISDMAIGTVDAVILEQLFVQLAQDAANATIREGHVLDEDDRALLTGVASEILPMFANARSNAERAYARDRQAYANAPEEGFVMLGERSAISQAFWNIQFANAYGASIRERVVGVGDRLYVFGSHVGIAAPALLAEEHPELLDDPLFIAITLERIEAYHADQA